MKKTEHFLNIIGMLTADGSKLLIDSYQRNYEWAKDRALRLLKTIISANEPVFIGTFTIYRANSSEVQIVDGQQRLVTLYIIMKALVDIMKQNPDIYNDKFQITDQHITVDKVQRAYQDLIDDYRTGDYKLTFNKKLMEEDFNNIIRNDKPSRFKNSAMEKNYKTIKKYLEEQTPDIVCNVYLHLLKTVECFCMECDSQREAWRTFTSINAYGQPPKDKYSIINSIYESIGYTHTEVGDVIENSTIFGKEDDSFINRFLFYKTNVWNTRPVIVNKFNNYIEEHNPQQTANDIIEFGKYDKQSQQFIEDNYLFPNPSMLVIVNHIKKLPDITPENIMKISKKFSAIFMRTQICPGTDHILETNTASLITKINKPEDIDNYVNFNDTTGRFYYANDELFKQCFQNYEIYKSSLLKNYILYALNNAISNAEQFIPKDKSVEHIMPQKDNKNNKLLHTIGNLTLTDASKNSIMGAKDFSKKKQVLKDSIYALNRYFDNIEEWNNNEIIKRGQYLADIACQFWNYYNV